MNAKVGRSMGKIWLYRLCTIFPSVINFDNGDVVLLFWIVGKKGKDFRKPVQNMIFSTFSTVVPSEKVMDLLAKFIWVISPTSTIKEDLPPGSADSDLLDL